MRPSLHSRFVSLALGAVILLASVSCASDPTAPTPDPIQQSFEVYSGPLDPGGLSTYLFTINRTGSVQLMLAGVVLGSPLRSISPVLRLQISRFDGSDCVPVVQVDTAPRLTAALHAYLEPATYCAMVSDPLGSLTETVGATMRIVAPALVRTGTEPGTATFSSTITPAGVSSRTFIASVQGTATITLTSVSAGPVEMGLGIGLLASDGSGCRVVRTQQVIPGPSAQLSALLDAGDYCAAVFDTGSLTKNESFTMTISYP